MTPDLQNIADTWAQGRITGRVLENLSVEILTQAGLPSDLLSGWSFRVNARASSRLGCCKYGPKVIEVSEWVVKASPGQAVRTLAHEMAHALAPRTDYRGRRLKPHGPEWERWAMKLGHPGTRVDETESEFLMETKAHTFKLRIVRCTGCGTRAHLGPRQQKRPLSDYVCRKCKGSLEYV